MQPIVKRLRSNRGILTNYGDDRAIHMLYDVRNRLKSEEGSSLTLLKTKVLAAMTKYVGTDFEPLSPEEKSRFIALRNKLITAFLQDIANLRDPSLDESLFEGFGIRPELFHGDQSMAAGFRSRLLDFLGRHASSTNLKALTSFSLPAGRQPAHLDEWIFLSFTGKNGEIAPVSSDVFDMDNGQKLITIPHQSRGSMTRDAEILYTLAPDSEIYELLSRQVLIEDREARDNILNSHMILIIIKIFLNLIKKLS